MPLRLIKKTLLIVVIVLVALQAPFIYRRYRYASLADKIAALNGARTIVDDPSYKQLKGVIHVHTSLGGHSTGGFDELIKAANDDGLDFVIMTEHVSELYDTAGLTLDGQYGRTLFVAGNETSTGSGDKLLVVPGGADIVDLLTTPTSSILAGRNGERLMFVAYPDEFRAWESMFDGIEVFSLHTAAKKLNPLLIAGDWLWSGSAYPELVISSQFVRPSKDLAEFDGVSSQRKISMFVGTDAHSNIGVKLIGDDAGHSFIHFKVDDYATIFRIASIHVLIPEGAQPGRDILLQAIKKGRYFAAIGAYGDADGFNFSAIGSGIDGRMGDEVPFEEGLMLRVDSPIQGRIVIIKNGTAVHEEPTSNRSEFHPDGAGTYRTEVYLDSLGEMGRAMPWIVSNPIYIR